MQIMLTYLNKKKAQDANSSTLMQQTDIPVSRQMNDSKSFNSGNQMDTTKEESKNSGGTLYQMMSAGKEKMTPFDPSMQKSIKDKRIEFELNQSNAQKASQQNIGGEMERVNQMLTEPIQLTMEELADRAKGFEKFRKSYRKNEAMEDNRNLLKDKYKRGKELGQEVNQSRNLIKKYSSQIEEIRKQNAMRGLVDENGEIIKTPEEQQLQEQVSKQKRDYQSQYNELKSLKTEIERIQALLERCRLAMQKDFEEYCTIQQSIMSK